MSTRKGRIVYYTLLDEKEDKGTLIRFGNRKFDEIIVSMAKKCNFDSNISDFNSMDLEKAKNDFFMDLSYFAVNYSGKVIGLSKKAIKAAKRP